MLPSPDPPDLEALQNALTEAQAEIAHLRQTLGDLYLARALDRHAFVNPDQARLLLQAEGLDPYAPDLPQRVAAFAEAYPYLLRRPSPPPLDATFMSRPSPRDLSPAQVQELKRRFRLVN